MAKCLLINPADRLFGERFNLRADMRADIRIRDGIRASISARVPWADVVNVFEKYIKKQ